MRRHIVVAIALLGLMPAAATLFADDAVKSEAKAPAAEHRMLLPRDLKWVDAPPSLPKGAKVVVLHGDPHAAGIFAMRISLPPGYKIAPHYHPADEHVTVISGIFNMGLGETWDPSKGHALSAGSVSIMPTGTRHFAWTKRGAVIQLHAMGPWGITYVNAQDDPRNQKQVTK